MIVRQWHRLYASVFGYFWLECPLCGEMYGGHEKGRRKPVQGIKIAEDKVVMICPRCSDELVFMRNTFYLRPLCGALWVDIRNEVEGVRMSELSEWDKKMRDSILQQAGMIQAEELDAKIMQEAKPEWLEETKVLNIKPGDVLVFRHKGILPDESWERLRDWIEDVFPGTRAFVLEEGMDVGIIRSE